MADSPLVVEREGSIVRLTLNRPEVGNALDMEMGRALVAAATACDLDSKVKCVVLTGAGRMFCAGGNVAPFLSAGDNLPAMVGEGASTLHLAMTRLARMTKPLLVLVNGPAAGAGFSLAIAGDIVIATRSAHFIAAYGALGFTPDGGMTWLLPRLVGLRRAQEIIFTNRRVDADEAASIGVVSRTVDDRELASVGAETARSIADSATNALGNVRSLLLQSFGNGFETQMELEARTLAQAAGGEEAREGLAAFAERRTPTFPITR